MSPPYRPLFVETDMKIRATLTMSELEDAIKEFLGEKIEEEFDENKVTIKYETKNEDGVISLTGVSVEWIKFL